ncbi:hypothetical protein GBA63_06045 [Rubrobacter tropicus]|uniref:Uncharacterized protein n=1 Tax=Rubrobacter tropicus TaxID=2653851 RepID=A0A6G8Q742_9ACTN|nr:hypothetical protein [Rubrobacter tropicus]QIN82259.1 hypothetical protein GBA63_06045 [Rubrobacter tropicus]
MIGKQFGKEEVNAALVLALAGAVAALAAGGGRRPSIGRLVSGVLSNPVPGRRATGAGGAAPTPHQQAA